VCPAGKEKIVNRGSHDPNDHECIQIPRSGVWIKSLLDVCLTIFIRIKQNYRMETVDGPGVSENHGEWWKRDDKYLNSYSDMPHMSYIYVMDRDVGGFLGAKKRVVVDNRDVPELGFPMEDTDGVPMGSPDHKIVVVDNKASTLSVDKACSEPSAAPLTFVHVNKRRGKIRQLLTITRPLLEFMLVLLR